MMTPDREPDRWAEALKRLKARDIYRQATHPNVILSLLDALASDSRVADYRCDYRCSMPKDHAGPHLFPTHTMDNPASAYGEIDAAIQRLIATVDNDEGCAEQYEAALVLRAAYHAAGAAEGEK